MNESGASERAVKTCPIKAQSTDVARAMASICNAQASILPELVETERLPESIRLSRSAQALAGASRAAEAGVRRRRVGLVGRCHTAFWLAALFFLIGLCLSITQRVGPTHRMLAMPEEFRSRMTPAHQAGS